MMPVVQIIWDSAWRIVELFPQEHLAVKIIWLCIPVFTLTGILVCGVTIRIRRRRRQHLRRVHELKPELKKLLVELVLRHGGSGTLYHSQVQEILRLTRAKQNRKVAVELILNLKITLTGSAALTLNQIYVDGKFDQGAIKRLEHRNVHVRISALKELSLMDCHETIAAYYKLRHKNMVLEEKRSALLCLAKIDPLGVIRMMILEGVELDDWREIELLSLLQNTHNLQRGDVLSLMPSLLKTQIRLWSKLAIAYLSFDQHSECVSLLNSSSEIQREQLFKVIDQVGVNERWDWTEVNEERFTQSERLDWCFIKQRISPLPKRQFEKEYSQLLEELSWRKVEVNVR